MYQFHIKIILIVAITVILSDVALGQDAPIEENNNITKSEDPKINYDIDNITDSSGDEDLTEDQKLISENKDEIPESPDVSENSQKIVFVVNTTIQSTDLLLKLIDEKEWFNTVGIIIDNNKIEQIEKEIFKKFPSLEKLSLKGNQLKKLETETFSEATKLTELNLDNNPLELPEEAHFLTTSSLRKFSMSDCNLKMIKEDTFIGMTGLEELDIGKNQISEATPITKELFEPLSNLTKLIIPLGSSEVLINEVCKTHALLQKICLDECDTTNDHSCIDHDTNDTEPKMILYSDPEESSPETQLPVSGSKEKPAEITEKPSEVTVILEKATEILQKAAEILQKAAEIPQKAAEIPEKAAEIPEKAAELPQKAAEIPEKAAEIPEKAAEIPEKAAEIPQKAAEIPEKTAEIPEKAAEIPEKAAEIPKKAAEITKKTPEFHVMRKMPGDSDIKLENQDETLDMKSNENGNIGIPSINVKKTGENVEPSTKSDVSSQSPNGAAIGVIIGVIIIIITGIIVKKNWRKIKSKWSSDERSSPAQISGQNVDRIRTPEEVPLKPEANPA